MIEICLVHSYCHHKHWAIQHFLQLIANRLLQFTVELEWISMVIKDLVSITFLGSGLFSLDTLFLWIRFILCFLFNNPEPYHRIMVNGIMSITNVEIHGRQYLLPTFVWSHSDSGIKPKTYWIWNESKSLHSDIVLSLLTHQQNFFWTLISGNHQWVDFFWIFLILNNENIYISQFHLRAHNTLDILSTLPGSGRHTGFMLRENATGWSRCRRAMSLVSKNGWKCEWNSTACTPRVTWSVSLGDVKSWSPSCTTRSSMGVSRLHPERRHLIAVP